jgi:hypothetical protein
VLWLQETGVAAAGHMRECFRCCGCGWRRIEADEDLERFTEDNLSRVGTCGQGEPIARITRLMGRTVRSPRA